jgi:hypothetical protein
MLIGLAPFAAFCGVVAGGLGRSAASPAASFRSAASAGLRAVWHAPRVQRPGGSGVFSALAVGVRHLVLFGALALVLWSGAAHPVALIGGLSLLPPVILALGFSAARVSD